MLGNHDGEGSRWHDGTADSLAVWSNTMRKRYFPNPLPDGFYTGNETREPFTGLLQNYYAWQWGDALFIVLDPFWSTPRSRGSDDNWNRTLGAPQYQWLQQTLEQSQATFKFVFVHHLVGGADKAGRGGVEAAPFYEWGGRNMDGTEGFREQRPGWPLPIHQLLVRQHVAAVFHGHDHLYGKQDLDGLVYQEVPRPGAPGNNNTRTAEEYGYTSGVLLGSSGHLRVRISPAEAIVDYIRARLPEDERSERRNAAVGHSYRIPAQPVTARSTRPALSAPQVPRAGRDADRHGRLPGGQRRRPARRGPSPVLAPGCSAAAHGTPVHHRRQIHRTRSAARGAAETVIPASRAGRHAGPELLPAYRNFAAAN